MRKLTKIFIILLLSSFLPLSLTPQNDSVKIVVADFDVFLIEKQYGTIVSEVLVSKLSADGTVRVIERSKLNKIIDEMALAQTGLINPEDAVKTGQIAGANRMVVGSVGKLGVEYVVNARIINVETGRVIKGFSLSGTSENDIAAMTSAMSRLILEVLAGREVSIPKNFQSQTAVIKNEATSDAKSVTGYWMTEWYDGNGKHTGSMHLVQTGAGVKGWTVESIGPASINAAFRDRQLSGTYNASYGSGTFEFTLAEEGNRLLGSYTASHGVQNTWNAWRIDISSPVTEKGGRVFSDWGRDIWTYPGTITKIEGGRFFITYDDGDTEWVQKSRLYPQKLMAGEVIFVAQQNKSYYTYATVLSSEKNRVYVEYKDGSKKWEPLSMIRILRVRVEGY